MDIFNQVWPQGRQARTVRPLPLLLCDRLAPLDAIASVRMRNGPNSTCHNSICWFNLTVAVLAATCNGTGETPELGVGADWNSHSLSTRAEEDRASDTNTAAAVESKSNVNVGRPAFNWTSADENDPPWSCGKSGPYTQLYNLDAVACALYSI
jgi:hypothetical protein